MEIHFDVKLVGTLVNNVSSLKITVTTEIFNNAFLANLYFVAESGHKTLINEAVDLLIKEVERQYQKKVEIVYDGVEPEDNIENTQGNYI